MPLIVAAGGGTIPSIEGSNRTILLVVLATSLVALAVAYYFSREVLAASQGTAKMQEIARAIQEGASAYLRRQFNTLIIFVVLVFFILFLLPADDFNVKFGRSLFFVVGAALSAITGFVGMWLAVRGNVRVAAAAQESGLKRALRIAFRTGGVAGMFTVGLGLLGATVVLLAYNEQAPNVLVGFGFGGALLAMFMRVGGGIFTKAADVGADLVGKVEQGIPEDDPRNAATIADNVGDNVGDCAGMAADLFESYEVTLVAALILGNAAFGIKGVMFPMIVRGIGVLTSILGIFAVSPRDTDRNGMKAINRGFFISAAASAVLVAVAAFMFLPTSFAELDIAGDARGRLSGNPALIATVATIIGLILAAVIQVLTEYFTATERKPVQDIAKSSLTGPATTILSGISVGLESAVYSALVLCSAIYGSYLLGGGDERVALYSIALTGMGMLTTVGVIVSMDTYGPVSDNAHGIAEMAGGLGHEADEIMAGLDAVGNTTKAITKGMAIATAVLAATSLFGSFREAVQAALVTAGESAESFSLSIDRPEILIGLVIGAAVTFLFSSLAISAVSRAAGRVVYEVRRQFREHPGIMDYSEKPDYAAVVDICTRDSLRELMTPGLLAVLSPIAVGFAFGYGSLGAYLGGAIAAGQLMAVFLSNSGGAWDNAKKLVEEGVYGGKGSEAHKATVIGDTVGDPFKDTAGPALNPLIKVMNLVAVLVAPTVVKYTVGADKSNALRLAVALIAAGVIAGSVIYSKRRTVAAAAEAELPAADPVGFK
ncbi:MAG TPA: sodium-translocating pyrophosphatase [Mycobacteriales bacterium]|jgi:K(+)-stimulated pyrophosphate-energized sodium pump|nr:sodium-translocating pyrophosphatase [Mycobacteriales bacterium]